MNNQVNPLLTENKLPLFDQIKVAHVIPAIEKILSDNKNQLEKMLAQKDFNWTNLVEPLEEMDDRLQHAWSPIKHMNAVVNSEELRKVYIQCVEKITAYYTELAQNEQLFHAIEQVAAKKDRLSLNAAQCKVIENKIRDFRLAGVALNAQDKKQFAELSQKLSKLQNKFEENLLDATNAWQKLITNQALLAGIPEHAVASAKQAAEQKKLEGWLFNLEAPSYIAVMTYADSRELRQEVYEAYVTRASDQGPHAGRWDNSQVMIDILNTRLAMAKLLGFNNYADYSLATKMAKTSDEVMNFLNDLAKASYPHAKNEYKELAEFANKEFHVAELAPWDIAYFSEKLCQNLHTLSQEDLRPYFPEDQVFNGMFKVVTELYNLTVTERKDVSIWHPDVRFFEIHDRQGNLRGQFYSDLYARSNKRGGAWMDECRNRYKKSTGEIQTPVAYLTCNFNGPVGKQPALFTHDEVLTLFHEFGHTLQHLLTTVDYYDVAGISGIPWDAVEIASQFNENWCWIKPGLDLITHHYLSGEKLPNDLFTKMNDAKNFQASMQIVRQLEFALFDFRLHMEFDPKANNQIQKILDDVRQKITVTPIMPYNRFQHGFSHIFAGGYAAGYYSYKWAEVLACDAFEKFSEAGYFNPKVGKEFLQTFLESGGVVDPMTLFIEFRGRKPEVSALLRYYGIN